MARIIKHFRVEVAFKSGRNVKGISKSQPAAGETFFQMFVGEDNKQALLVAMPNVETITSEAVFEE